MYIILKTFYGYLSHEQQAMQDRLVFTLWQ